MSEFVFVPKEIDEKSVTTVRMLAVDAIEKANSGHPGLPLGAAPMAYALWQNFYKHNPKNPDWINRDRFVLSAGHGSMLQYALLHLSGYRVSLEDLKQFRQWGSKTPGHPEYGHTPGIETTTGPLGQGLATGVGLAMGEKFLGQVYNTNDFSIIDYHTYGIVSDGDMMEGVAAEAASLAGTLSLGKLIYMYDSNGISIEGSTDLAFREDVGARFEAYGWQVIEVSDGNDMTAIANAIATAKEDSRPSLIVVKTHIGFGSPKVDSEDVHGSPLGAEAIKVTREFYNWPDEDFFVPEEVGVHMSEAITRGEVAQKEWQEKFAEYAEEYPEKSKELLEAISGKLPENWDQNLPVFKTDDSAIATRSASEKVMQVLAQNIPTFMGGSADLASSNKTFLKGKSEWTGLNQDEAGYNVHYGIREHAMSAITNGLALTKPIIPFAATFFVFSDYARGAMRLSALMRLRAIYVLTHDSIGQGEDGATHQPIEHLASFRAMPNMHVLRPADANETVEAWKYAVARVAGPSILVLSRQNLPIIDNAKYSLASNLHKGAYVMNLEIEEPTSIIIATGSEVSLALEAAEKLIAEGEKVRVVSMPCWEAFERQDASYKDSVLPPHITKRVVVEAGSRFGWERYAGTEGKFVTIDGFGASAPGAELFKHYGFTVENIIELVRS